MISCIRAATKQIGNDRANKYCKCTWEGISATIPFEEFIKLGSDQAMSPNATTALRTAVTECGGSAQKLDQQFPKGP